MKTIKDIFENLGQNIIENIHEVWDEAILNIEVIQSEHFVSFKGYYLRKLEPTKVGLKVSKFSHDVGDELRLLHQMTNENDHSKWNRAIFRVTPNSQFTIEFIWDQTLEDEIKRLSKTEGS